MCIKIQAVKYTRNYTYTYAFLILCFEFQVARMLPKLCRICPHYIED